MTYNRLWVETHLPSVWDAEHVPLNEFAPDIEMAKFKTRGVASHQDPPGLAIAEIRRAWEEEHAVSRDERAAMLLVYGLGFEQQEAAEVEGVTQQAISNRIYRGVGKLVEFLTGKPLLNDDADPTTEQDGDEND